MDNRFENIRCVIVKLTNRCNIRCEYCYENIIAKGSNMSSEIFQEMVEIIVSSTNEKKILLILHGGEPTILSAAWFRENLSKGIEIAKKYGKDVEYSIQTNLINIPDEKLNIFKQYRVRIGGSIDNPDSLPDSMRPLAHKALNTYYRAKELGLSVGVLSTINTSNLGVMPEFCNWLYHELGINHFKANLAYSVGTGLELLVPEAQAFFKAQRDVIEFMLETNGEFQEENLSQEIIRFFENYRGGKNAGASLCGDQTCGAGSRVVGVTPEGNVLPCGRFAWDDNEFFLGHLNDDDIDKYSQFHKRLTDFHTANPENWEHCNNCEARGICDYGCQGFIVRSIKKLNIECLPTKLRFQYYKDNAEALQGLYEKICERNKRPAMSPLSQKISKLKSLLPEEEHALLREELLQHIPA